MSQRPPLPHPDQFRFHVDIEVRFRDLDAMGHVNNAVFLTYVESARVGYWQKLSGRSSLEQMDIILARTEIDYRAPINLGETVEIGLRVAEIRRSSFAMEFVMLERATQRLAAEGRNVLVFYDYASGRSAELPARLRATLEAEAASVA